MRAYIKPLFEFIVLAVEERFAAGSLICTVVGTCPTSSAPGCSFVAHGVTKYANQS